MQPRFPRNIQQSTDSKMCFMPEMEFVKSNEFLSRSFVRPASERNTKLFVGRCVCVCAGPLWASAACLSFTVGFSFDELVIFLNCNCGRNWLWTMRRCGSWSAHTVRSTIFMGELFGNASLSNLHLAAVVSHAILYGNAACVILRCQSAERLY